MAAEKYHSCSVCLEPFSEPKVLPCCHTFCLKCLEKTARSARKKGEIACPQCRKTHDIPAGGLAGLLTDFIAAYELEVTGVRSPQSRGAKATLICGECESGAGPVESYCSDCQNYLCQDCIHAHKRFKAYRGHKVIPIQELDAATLQSSQIQYCAIHKNEAIKLYCETCMKLICRDCTLVDHRQHSYKFVHDARKAIDDKLSSLGQSVKLKNGVFRGDLGEIKKVESAAVSYSEILKADINLFFDKLMRSLEAQRKQLLTQAEAECQKDLKQIWADKVFHQTTISQISAVFGLSEKARKCTSDVEMILTALQSVRQLSQLKETEWDANAFIRVVTSPAKFTVGEIIATDKTGKLERVSSPEFNLEVVNQPTQANIGGRVSFTVSYPFLQSLVDTRSGSSIRLQCCKYSQEADLKVIVKYGNSQKKLDDKHFSIEEADKMHGASSRGKKKNRGISMRLVCGGSHTVTFKVGDKEVENCKFVFFVHGQPQHGAQVRKGPDWQHNVSYQQQNMKPLEPSHMYLPPQPTYSVATIAPVAAMETTSSTSDVIGTVNNPNYAIGYDAAQPVSANYYAPFGSSFAAPAHLPLLKPSAYSSSRNPDSVCVQESSGGVSYYNWGKDGAYEIELV